MYSRREALRAGLASFALLGAAILNSASKTTGSPEARSHDEAPGNRSKPEDNNAEKERTMKIHYLEIVTPDVSATCALYSAMHSVAFGDADQNLGGARTAKLPDGGMLGVRAPLRETEKPVVRPYVLVENIKASVAAAAQSGAQVAMDATEIPGYGQFAIVVHGGIESGLWQL